MLFLYLQIIDRKKIMTRRHEGCILNECVCPVHGTKLYYSKSEKMHSCTNNTCVYHQGLEDLLGDSAMTSINEITLTTAQFSWLRSEYRAKPGLHWCENPLITGMLFQESVKARIQVCWYKTENVFKIWTWDDGTK